MCRKFDIVTDSACDMSEVYLSAKRVDCVPLGFTMDNVNYAGESGEKITEKAFYQKLREGGMPTTYQVTGEQAKAHIERHLKEGKDVLVLAFSSGLSGTAGSFLVAARELQKQYPKQNVRVVDSLCASMGEGLLLDYVLRKADSGAELDETVAYAESLKGKICHHFTVDNLFHLKRGGRVSATSAVIGSILKIKPIMRVDDEGKLTVVNKVMGRRKALASLVDRVLESADMEEEDPIFISHGDCMEDVEYVKSLLLIHMPKVRIEVNYVGSVIGAHAGAGVLAIFHKGICR